jgi:hypothetical protein
MELVINAVRVPVLLTFIRHTVWNRADNYSRVLHNLYVLLDYFIYFNKIFKIKYICTCLYNLLAMSMSNTKCTLITMEFVLNLKIFF